MAAMGVLGVLYAFGVFLASRALYLLPQGKEHGPGGHPYPLWTSVHFASALLFAALAMLQLLAPVRRRYPLLHRYCGRIAVACGLIAAITGACIPFGVVPPRPMLERAYIVIYFLGVAACLLQGYYAARRRDFTLHRIWMIRTVASAGAVMTQRIFFPILAITFGVPNFGVFWREFVAAFALGWVINLALAEGWLRWEAQRNPSVA
jgi:hypothetical protein